MQKFCQRNERCNHVPHTFPWLVFPSFCFYFFFCQFWGMQQTLLKSMQEISASIYVYTYIYCEAAYPRAVEVSGFSWSFGGCMHIAVTSFVLPTVFLPAWNFFFFLQIDMNWQNEIAISCDKFQWTFSRGAPTLSYGQDIHPLSALRCRVKKSYTFAYESLENKL